MDCTWPELFVSQSTAFDRFRPARTAGPALLHDAIGHRLWGFRMDMNQRRDQDRLMAAAREIAAQRGESDDLRCDDCGVFTPRWLLDSVDPRDRAERRTFRNGVEVLRCDACWAARAAGLSSRLKFGRTRVEVWA